MASKKKQTKLALYVEYNGTVYEGYRWIEGTKLLRQSVHFGGASRQDNHYYRPAEGSYMEHCAETWMRELVVEELRKSAENAKGADPA